MHKILAAIFKILIIFYCVGFISGFLFHLIGGILIPNPSIYRNGENIPFLVSQIYEIVDGYPKPKLYYIIYLLMVDAILGYLIGNKIYIILINVIRSRNVPRGTL